MKIKTDKLNGVALDWAVAQCEGVECDEDNAPIWFERDGPYAPRCPYTPSTNWNQCGLIIDREGIATSKPNHKGWMAQDYMMRSWSSGPTAPIAAMRCFVASKLGDEVDVPDELLTESEVASESAAPDPDPSPQRPRGG